jgi:hypothetical protein
MDRKDARIGVRLTEDEIEKVQQVANLTGCNLSEAVRLMVRGTQLKTVAVIEITPPSMDNLVLA